MKTLRINEVDVEIEEARCDWCEEEKACYRSVGEVEFFHLERSFDWYYVMKDYSYRILGGIKPSSRPRLKRVLKDTSWETEGKPSHICGECAQQLPVIKEER